MFRVSEAGEVRECVFCGRHDSSPIIANERSGICPGCLEKCMSALNNEKIEEERKKWEARSVDRLLAKKPERKREFMTTSVPAVKRLYAPPDIGDLDYLEALGFPGEFPFTRGVQPTMYRGQFWTMRQYAGFGDAEGTNARFKYLLEQGQTGLSVAFDLPTQMGYDSDHPRSLGEVGKVGVAIDTLADMEILFEGIPLDKVTTSMTINAPAAVLLGMYCAMAEKQNIPMELLGGTVQNDILKEYVARGTYIYPPLPSIRLCSDLIEFCSTELPRWNPISISGYHIREAGATAVQELAFTLLNGLTYVDAALQKGLSIDEFSGRLSFFFDACNNILEEVAKFRAARRLWARFMKDKGAKNDNSLKLRFHTQTAGFTLTAQQPLNNIVRVAFQALAGVLGGTQSLHTNSYDEALCLPCEEAARTALRTQQIIAYESGTTDTIDPLGGSYYIESLTDNLEKHVLEYIARVNQRGGMLKSIEDGFIQREIHNSAYASQLRQEKNEDTIVGVNKFHIQEKPPCAGMKIKKALETKQKRFLRETRKKRDRALVDKTLARIEEAARSGENLLPSIIESVKAYGSIGEICDVLRGVFGEYIESKM